jgi:hypothetical protein
MEDTNPFPIDHGIDQDFPAADEPAIEAPPVIGGDERRMHVRAYNYWVSLLDGRPFPSIDDLEPDAVDFGPHSVLLDFTSGPDNAAIPYLGSALRDEGGLSTQIREISDVPARSVLSRLTDHYLEILANRAPIGFEAEYVGHRGVPTMYRGILMPFSSNGDEIDFIYGVINWKDVVEIEVAPDIRSALEAAFAEAPAPASVVAAPPVWADARTPQVRDEHAQFSAPSLELIIFETEGMIAPGSEIYERLAVARESADTLNFSEQRSRAALYAALGNAYDFALAAQDDPETYAEILDDAGLKAQKRAPMTPLVKLIFGVTYDKTRLAEYAAALCHALRQNLPAGAMPAYLDGHDGGLKAVVQAERAYRRPSIKPDREASMRAKLAAVPAIAALPAIQTDSDYVSVIGRREADGSFSMISVTAAEPGELLRAVKHLQR